MKASIRALRSETKSILSAVSHGQTVTITYRGKDYAKLVPIKAKPTKKSTHEAFGMWQDHQKTETVNDFINKLREGRKHHDA